MNINTRQSNNLSYKPQMGGNKNSSQNGQNLNFTANPQKIIKKAETIYKNAEDIFEGVNKVLGKDYLQNLLTRAGISYDSKTITHANRTLKSDTVRTFKSLVDIPFRLASSFTETFKINVGEGSRLGKWMKKNETERAFHAALDLIEEFERPAISNGTIDSEKASKIFKDTITSNITRIKKNYESRDERTLNRIATATISALYSGADFYNISMLQKDNNEEAEKSRKKRLGQELTRMATSAGLTFISLGILDRYTKKNILLNASVIAGATLISEIFSRVKKGNSLVPLTPEQAAQRAQKNKNKNQQKEISFKSRLNDEQQAIRKLLQLNKELTQQVSTLDKTQKTTSETKKNKAKIFSYVLGAVGLASAFFVGSKAIKGDFEFSKEKKAFLEWCKQAQSEQEKAAKLKTLTDKFDKKSEKWALIDKFKKTFTQREVETDLEELKNKLIEYKDDKEIGATIQAFIEHIEHYAGKKTIKQRVDIPVISGIYSGVTKIFKTVYDILSLPGLLISNIINKDHKESDKLFEEIKNKLAPNYKKELTELGQLLKSNKSKEEIIEIIKKRTRNVEIGAETGDLANISRTMVTALTTWFFVSDHWNEVLIESEGKDIEGAKEERNERLMHKLSNFVINGTLMNTFNTIFKGWLNKSLLGAVLVAAATETTNEFMVRKSICQPIGKKESKQAIIDYENEQLNKGGFAGWWARTFKKITGKKTLTQKAGIKTEIKAHQG